MKIDRNAPLTAEDKSNKTLGCRHSNPGICKSNGLNNVCAFVRKDTICLKPPKSWTKQYEILSCKDAEVLR